MRKDRHGGITTPSTNTRFLANSPDVRFKARLSRKVGARDKDRVRLKLYFIDNMLVRDKERFIDGEELSFVASPLFLELLSHSLGDLLTVTVVEKDEPAA